MSATGFVYHPRCLEHRAGGAHPERPERVRVIREALQHSGLLGELDELLPERAQPEWIAAVHPGEHVQAVVAACEQGRPIDADTQVSKHSHEAALLASGGLVQACERVLDGRWKNAFVACRPPGHHAERAQAMGFCLYNHAAVAARWLRAQGVERVAILDWDVHHGNGTQHLFEEDASVFYASLHQWPLYPGTGARSERGRGAGLGATLNCPQPPGAGEREWLGALEREILPAIADFRPGFLLVSAGFDAHARDPLAQTELDEHSFARMSALALACAREQCAGRLVSLLEGGYDLAALAASAHAHVAALKEAA